MFLRPALASHPHLTFAVLGDNLHVLTVLSPSSPPGLPSRSPAGTWEYSLQSIQPPIGCISRGPFPVIHKLTTSSIKHLLPRQKHENIHVPYSFHFYNPTSWFKGVPFKWSSGNFNMARFAFHDDLRLRHCHAYPDPHSMDGVSFVSHCPTCEHLVQTYIQCWRTPFATVVSQWWSATTHVGERRNFVRGLIPMSLYTKLTTPPSGRRKPAHCHDLKVALMARVPLLLDALYRTLEWLNDPPPPSPPHPPNRPKPMRAPLVALQHVTHRPTVPPCELPPSVPPPRQGCTQAFKAPPPPFPGGTRQGSKTRPPAP